MDQSELEHRTSKARFHRTNGRLIPLQLSKIERRQRHIRAIRENLYHLPGSETNLDLENVANDPQLQYNIGKTENTPVHVPTFLQNNDGDPGNLAHSYHFHLPMSPMQNFFSKLYLIQDTRPLERSSLTSGIVPLPTPTLVNLFFSGMIASITTNFVDFTSPHMTSGVAQTPSIQALRVAILCFLRTTRMLQTTLQLGIPFCTRAFSVFTTQILCIQDLACMIIKLAGWTFCG